MTDGGGDVMEKSQNGDFVGPQPQDNVSTIIQDTEMAEDEARSEATFRFTVTGFSKLKVGVSHSSFNYWKCHSLMVTMTYVL